MDVPLFIAGFAGKIRSYSVTALLLAGTIIAGCAESDIGINNAGAEYSVVRIIDGDTVELRGGSFVRYLGIDTPEVREKLEQGWRYSPEAYSLNAKEYNRKLIGNKKIKLEFDVRKKDKYGRLLAYVYVDGKMLNEELLRQGYAMLKIYPPNVKHTKLLVAAQKDAMLNKRGIWTGCRVIPADNAYKHVNEIHTVTGRVQDVEVSWNNVFLDFGREAGFKGIIYVNNLVVFEKEGVFSPEYYKGKYVRITGKISDKYGPGIIAYHPFQIEVIEDK